MKNVVAVVLAGGKGSRLEPLTRDRAKPAVPFGGHYRIIDFSLSNCLNSGIRKVLLLTQYKAMSLDRHVNLGWRRFFQHELGEFIDVIPPQQRVDDHWYQGTADAVYQNIYALEKERPEHVVVLAGDHIYKMDYGAMLRHHIETQAALTIGSLPVSRNVARQFGVMQVDESHRIWGFQEKPETPATLPDNPQLSLASMGIYVFSAKVLFDLLCQDANSPTSSHDFGRDIIPSMIRTHPVYAFPFQSEVPHRAPYWKDVGTLDAYFEASMDLVSSEPLLDLYQPDWPIRTYQPIAPPPKFVFGSRGDSDRTGCAIDSLVCSGAVIAGGTVCRSLISPFVQVHEHAKVMDSILLDGVVIERGAFVRKAIIDKGVVIPEGIQIGVNAEADRERGLTLTPQGVVVIAKGDKIRQTAPSPIASFS